MVVYVLTLYLFISVILLSIVFVYSFYRIKSGFGQALGLLCLSLDIYLLGYIIELNSTTLEEMIFWNQVEYFGIPFFPALWLTICMIYTGKIKRLKDRRVWLIFIIPLISFFARLTNDWHHLYYVKYEYGETLGIPVVMITRGPLYYIQMSYVVFCLIVCTVLYYKHCKRSSQEEKMQFRLFLAVSILPFVSLLTSTILPKDSGIDGTALVMPVCILLIVIALSRYNFLEVKLMARERVFVDSLDGFIILNRNYEIMDYNEIGTRFCGWMNIPLKQSERFISDNPELNGCISERKPATFAFNVDGQERFLAIKPKEINNHFETVGLLLIISDVTERELTNRKLLELARIDELSGIYNRRYFIEQAQVALERAQRYQEHLSVIMLDIDDFKQINDNYGHGCGDQVIRTLSELLKTSFRKTDIYGRIGGEEFSIVMINTKAQDAYVKAEFLRKKIADMGLIYNNQNIQVTVSLGVAELERQDMDLDELLRSADAALYQSKRSGKNQTTTYSLIETQTTES